MEADRWPSSARGAGELSLQPQPPDARHFRRLSVAGPTCRLLAGSRLVAWRRRSFSVVCDAAGVPAGRPRKTMACPLKASQSARRARIGSTRRTRAVALQTATAAVIASSSAAHAQVPAFNGSTADMRYCRKRSRPTAPATPAVMPTATGNMLWRSNAIRRRPGEAPTECARRSRACAGRSSKMLLHRPR
jgi:hypothetical protein